VDFCACGERFRHSSWSVSPELSKAAHAKFCGDVRDRQGASVVMSLDEARMLCEPVFVRWLIDGGVCLDRLRSAFTV
jgi:hypothetical protein